MATVDIYCTQPGNASDGGWYRSGNLYWYACVAAASDSQSVRTDNYYNYGYTQTFYAFGLGSVPTYITINSLTLWSYAGRTGTNAGSYKPEWALGGAFTSGTRVYPTGGWYSDAMSRPGGGSWTRSDLSSLQVRFYAYGDSGGGREIYVDCMLVRIDYSYILLLNLSADNENTLTDTSVNLVASYNANGDGGTDYRILYKVSGGSYDDPAWTGPTGNTGVHEVSRSLSGLTPGTLYYWKLQARNSADTLQESAENSFTTLSGTKGSRMMMMG